MEHSFRMRAAGVGKKQGGFFLALLLLALPLSAADELALLNRLGEKPQDSALFDEFAGLHRDQGNTFIFNCLDTFAQRMQATYTPLRFDAAPLPLAEKTARHAIMLQRIEETKSRSNLNVLLKLQKIVLEYMRKYPEDHRHNILLAAYYDYFGAWPVCAALYMQMISQHPGEYELYPPYMKYMALSGYTTVALQDAACLFPYLGDIPVYREALVNLAMERSAPRRVLSVLIPYAKQHPSDAHIQLQLGRLYQADRNLQDARKAFFAAHQLGGVSDQALLKLAELSLEQYQKAEALSWLNRLKDHVGLDRFIELFSESALSTELDMLDEILSSEGITD